MLTTQFRFGKWHSACCNCAIMQRNWPAHASPGNILKNHPKEDDLQTLIGKKWAEIIDDVILLHSFGAKFSHSNNCKKKNACFHEMVQEIKVPLFFLSLILLIRTQEWLPLRFHLNQSRKTLRLFPLIYLFIFQPFMSFRGANWDLL